MLKSVRSSMYLLGVVLLGAVLSLLALAHYQQNRLASSAEQAFIGKDVVADILPPPMYLIEMRLVLSQAVEGSMPVPEALKHYERLVADYDQRVAHWSRHPPLGLEKQLLGRQHATAKVFIGAAKTELLDKLTAGDKGAAMANLPKINALYADHRAGVDDTVVAGNRLAETSVLAFSGETRNANWVLLACASLVFAGVFFVIARNLRGILQPIDNAYEFTRGISDGDLTRSLALCDKVEIARLQGALLDMQGSLRSIVGKVRSSTHSISHSSAEIAHGNLDLSKRTEQTAANLQQAASSMHHVTGTVKHSADSARLANQLASNAAEVAARGGQVVSQVVSTMDEINTSSKKISDIIGVIDGIAFQTNILALNAAVEAARAGEQGRGFAVVASEVRSLAGRSAEAAKEIKNLIGASVERVETGSRLVEDAGTTMQEIVTSVQRVSDIIGEISSAAAEQSDGISQVNTSVVELDQMTQQNAALVEEGAAAAESLRDQAQRLSQVVDTFKLGASDHKPTRAAAPIAKPKPAAAKPRAAAPSPAPRPAAASFTASPAPSNTASDEWETF
jgi:methyl-accepting chemotaxis protein-1 (serine sensor receptor)